MVRRRVIEIALALAVMALLVGGILISVTTIGDLNEAFRGMTTEMNIWAPSQQEREALRMRDLLRQIEVGAAVDASAYEQQLAILTSRMTIYDDDVAVNAAFVTERERELRGEFKVAYARFLTLEPGTLPDATRAAQLILALNEIIRISHDIVLQRLNLSLQIAVITQRRTAQLQYVLITNMVLLALVSSTMLVMTRRSLSSDLRGAYAEAQQRAHELETSQAELAEAHEAKQRQNSQLSSALATLESAIAEREQLATTVQQLSLPIIPVLRGVLVLPLIGDLPSDRLTLAAQRLLATISSQRAHVAIMDITGVHALDDRVAQELLTLSRAIALLGCQPVLVGISPVLAEELVQVGFQTETVQTHSTLQGAVEWALRSHAITPRP